MTRPPIRFHRILLSGHCHRVELLMRMLEVPFEAVDVDAAAGDLRQPAFLALNRFGQVPVIEDGGIVVADSNAILTYLARRYDPTSAWMPSAPPGCSVGSRPRPARWPMGPVARAS